MCILVISAAITLGVVTWCSEPSIRLAGYGLQLIGMVFAIRGLLNIRAHFGLPLLRQLFFNWLKSFPKWKRDIVVGVGMACETNAAMKCRAEVWTPDDPGQPIEKRIEGIIKNIDRIRDEQRGNTKLLDELMDSHEEHKKKVLEQTGKMEENIRSDIESLHTSDLVTSLVGLVWLTVGITMSTMAPELYKWLQ